MLADPEVEAVIVGSPSDQHEEQAIRCLEAGKHVLLEIPIALSLAGAERVAAAAERSGKVLAMCHPMRFRREREALRQRLLGGEETIRHIAGRFFIHRLKNVGATGYERSWTDNILWHHFCHFVDLSMFLLEGTAVRRVQSFMPDVHPLTGIPMECVLLIETDKDQSAMIHGSYHAAYRFYDKLIVTDKDTYFFDILKGTLTTRAGSIAIEDEQTNCARVTRDFVAAVRTGRAPLAPARIGTAGDARPAGRAGPVGCHPRCPRPARPADLGRSAAGAHQQERRSRAVAGPFGATPDLLLAGSPVHQMREREALRQQGSDVIGDGTVLLDDAVCDPVGRARAFFQIVGERPDRSARPIGEPGLVGRSREDRVLDREHQPALRRQRSPHRSEQARQVHDVVQGQRAVGDVEGPLGELEPLRDPPLRR